MTTRPLIFSPVRNKASPYTPTYRSFTRELITFNDTQATRRYYDETQLNSYARLYFIPPSHKDVFELFDLICSDMSVSVLLFAKFTPADFNSSAASNNSLRSQPLLPCWTALSLLTAYCHNISCNYNILLVYKLWLTRSLFHGRTSSPYLYRCV